MTLPDRISIAVKKQDRIERAEQRSGQRSMYAEQDASVDAFVHECRLAIPPEDFERFHAEAIATAGDSSHVFDMMVDALSRTKTEITPNLRKAIERVLGAYKWDRERLPALSKLRYDDYWKREYGYE